ncbi:prepilin-type N-terminal cleavage/methylation domain-containing protein [Bradyrhizobium sp. CCGUVB14]|uniref:type IV pilus modification PilV family protein n=1 Tax=Bradyrhizobium sp. CCGUVB14 TaxID=2949628 RepID=UPI0020B26C96|nr:prepilin-type N-terminal cleavage/methylation domain-containing protein [Bradyrhizobium sp. CCGUVB14]MCP3442026.1 prepilin-type N-terminal cleavage/methylation domain-containing protein [Bradyrhizobium sp. CCGUVB14]
MPARASTCRSSACSSRLTAQRGFTLIEVLIAFVVLAVGLGTLAVGITTALRTDARVHNKHILDQIAESRLEAAGRSGPLKSGRREGRTGRYRWREVVTAVQFGKTATQDGATAPGNMVVPSWVEIVVQDEAGAETKLAALKLAPGAVQ